MSEAANRTSREARRRSEEATKGAKPPSARQLARDAAQGDLQAAQSLLEAVGPAMARAVRSVMGPTHPDVDDVVQQSLISFVQSLGQFRGDSEPSFYAYRIAVRAALASRKRARAQQIKLAAFARENQNAPTTAPSPTESALAAERRKLVRRLLDELPAEQAETLALHTVVGLRLKEVASIGEVPLNTVKSRLRLAKQTLRAHIAADPGLAEQLEVKP
jgi:RNA polymerase sigma-70 factor, ECF subfamily